MKQCLYFCLEEGITGGINYVILKAIFKSQKNSVVVVSFKHTKINRNDKPSTKLKNKFSFTFYLLVS